MSSLNSQNPGQVCDLLIFKYINQPEVFITHCTPQHDFNSLILRCVMWNLSHPYLSAHVPSMMYAKWQPSLHVPPMMWDLLLPEAFIPYLSTQILPRYHFLILSLPIVITGEKKIPMPSLVALLQNHKYSYWHCYQILPKWPSVSA